MPIRIKPASASVPKYKSNTQSAGPSYTAGIQNPRRDWQASASAAEGTWEQGVQQAISTKSYSKGITPDAANKQKNNALTLGVQRYPQGTANAADTWAKNTQPVLDAMGNVPDAPRGPKMSQQNFDRQHAFAAAAHSAKKNK